MRALEERWKKQANADDLVPLSILGLDNEVSLENKGGWCAQLSRSIDSRVNEFDPNITNPPLQEFNEFVSEGLVNWEPVQEKEATLFRKFGRFETATMSRLTRSCYLDLKKGRLVDSSIHTTNIHQIRRAKHFIYIESQYFMGSSFMWEEHRKVKCGNMIAAEVRIYDKLFCSLFCFIANF